MNSNNEIWGKKICSGKGINIIHQATNHNLRDYWLGFQIKTIKHKLNEYKKRQLCLSHTSSVNRATYDGHINALMNDRVLFLWKLFVSHNITNSQL